MSLWRLFKEKKTPEEIQGLRDIRKFYYDYISTTSAIVTNGVKNNTITPETSSEISTILTKSKNWLQTHPDADVDEIGTKYDLMVSNIKDRMDNDKPKIIFKNTLKIYSVNFDQQKQQGKLNDAQYTKLKQLLKDEEEWYKKEQAKASELDYTNEIQKLNDTIVNIGLNPDAVQSVKKDVNEKTNKEIEKELSEKKETINKAESNDVDIYKGGSIVLSTGLQVFFNLLIVFLCLLSGSFAANMAIGRAPMYRIVYFIFGAIPFYVPFVLFYTLYRRIAYGPIPMYAVLPLSIEPAVTRFGKYLWYPFYWVPDKDSVDQYLMFQNSLKAMVATSASVASALPSPPGPVY